MRILLAALFLVALSGCSTAWLTDPNLPPESAEPKKKCALEVYYPGDRVEREFESLCILETHGGNERNLDDLIGQGIGEACKCQGTADAIIVTSVKTTQWVNGSDKLTREKSVFMKAIRYTNP